MTEPFLCDPDCTLYLGDALDVLAEMPDGCVDCCVTSPPYWGLRDYGTGSWEGGDESCDHTQRMARGDAGRISTDDRPGNINPAPVDTPIGYRDVCGKCGARRVDNQLGLEATPDLYVARMVAVFREVRRVLADHGTCWVNMGDGYAANTQGSPKPGMPHTKGKVAGHIPNAWSGITATPVRHPTKPKDLVGMPWRLAFALQADGWYLRSDIVWSKPNPMPESVTDRPTKAHEYVFLLSKQPRYWFDQEAVREQYEGSPEWRYGRVGEFQNRAMGLSEREPRNGDAEADGAPLSAASRSLSSALGPDGRHKTSVQGSDGSLQHRDGERWPNSGRNVRSVWEIATQPFPEAHFATFPEELVRRCILAGCPEWVCSTCGKPRERIMERGDVVDVGRTNKRPPVPLAADIAVFPAGPPGDRAARLERGGFTPNHQRETRTLGWSDCGCIRSTGSNGFRPGVVLDPFMGSGTTALVARKHGRRSIGIELNEDYCRMAARRLQQLSLLAEPA